jgi:hypothetical protein
VHQAAENPGPIRDDTLAHLDYKTTSAHSNIPDRRDYSIGSDMDSVEANYAESTSDHGNIPDHHSDYSIDYGDSQYENINSDMDSVGESHTESVN